LLRMPIISIYFELPVCVFICLMDYSPLFNPFPPSLLSIDCGLLLCIWLVSPLPLQSDP
jgi:hypothetical protein